MAINPISGADASVLASAGRARAPARAPQAETAPELPDATGRTDEEARRDAAPAAIQRPDEAPRVISGGTRLRIDEQTKRIVAQILDQNNEVIRQIPPQELLQISARFRELRGLLFDEKA